jgi:hypothetical protein
VTLTVTLQAPLPVSDVTFRRENALDRFAKSIDFAFEAQTGDHSFDEQVYVECDNHILARHLLQDATRRNTIRSILTGFSNISKVDLSRKGVSVTIRNFSEGDLSQSAFAGLLRDMKQIGCGLPRLPGGFAVSVDSNIGKLLIGVPIVLLVAGIFATLFGARAYPPINQNQFFLTGLSFGWKLALFYAIFCYFALKGRSRAVREFGLAVFLGAVASVFSCWGSFAVLNGTLDRSPVAFHYVQIVEKKVSRNKKSTNYWVTYASWRNPGSLDRLNVNEQQYYSLNANDYARIETRAGRFGWEWLVGIAPDSSRRAK